MPMILLEGCEDGLAAVQLVVQHAFAEDLGVSYSERVSAQCGHFSI